MEYETLMTIQAYAKFGLLTLTFIVFYSYAYSIYKRNKRGSENYRDFEKYSNLVLDDNIESKPLEDNREDNIKKNEQKSSDENQNFDVNKKI
ncbi:MAG: CcoQ/FixQ family Cbb3-type cytochrome c oxidase assembly chaperone [Campylobacterota bacterium]|nr:CcoQ/FixQ family Cbb3-type cytochrome c oxidase assembly chaperone [Campylobacterota bacterium]